MANKHSNNDIKFNILLADNSKSQDLHSSSFSTQKLQNSSQNGGAKNIVPTATYLQQIDEKYSQMYMIKQIDKAKKGTSHNQKPSHIDHTQVNNCMDLPNKFRQQKQSEILGNNSYIPQIQPIVKSELLQPQNPQLNDTISPMKAPVLNIPGDISLSRGVSERGLK
ncbi:unnamed protein product [Paramecium sonneborni]|uniref:Uncharacterized protein n=1 Tax=Paramecium sonneborni TaxID=65129 RepID=A0A8S1LHA6_9CILI|nr:unnamed protein product [Paramecium sonneborni]